MMNPKTAAAKSPHRRRGRPPKALSRAPGPADTAKNNGAPAWRRPWLADYQLKAIFCPQRYAVIEATTKAGKTVGCLIWLLEQAVLGRSGQNYWWVAPVYSQAKIAFRRLKAALRQSAATQVFEANDGELTVTLANGAVIWFKSAEKPDNLYGEDVYAAVIDEASRCREEAWHAIRSTLTATRGPIRIIGNVKGRHNWAYKIARQVEREMKSGNGNVHFARITAYDAVKAGIISKAEVEDARARLPKHVFEELYEAKPANIEGRVYKSFEYPYNVRSDVKDLGGELLVGLDFNVNPMSAVLASRAGNQLHIWGEIVLQNSNTDDLCAELRRRYPDRKITIYPDPSGKARKTSAGGKTDFTIIGAHGMKVVAPEAAPAVSDRINEVNGMLCTADKVRRLFVHPDCVNLVEALDGLSYQEGTNNVDKSTGLDHITDALGYLIHCLFPIQLRRVETQRMF